MDCWFTVCEFLGKIRELVPKVLYLVIFRFDRLVRYFRIGVVQRLKKDLGLLNMFFVKNCIFVWQDKQEKM